MMFCFITIFSLVWIQPSKTSDKNMWAAIYVGVYGAVTAGTLLGVHGVKSNKTRLFTLLAKNQILLFNVGKCLDKWFRFVVYDIWVYPMVLKQYFIKERLWGNINHKWLGNRYVIHSEYINSRKLLFSLLLVGINSLLWLWNLCRGI